LYSVLHSFLPANTNYKKQENQRLCEWRSCTCFSSISAKSYNEDSDFLSIYKLSKLFLA